MFCQECGKQIKDSAKFCPFCGAKTERGYEAEGAVKKKSAVGIIIAACAALVFAAVCFVVIMVVMHLFRPEEDHNSTTAYAVQTEAESETDAESEAVSEEQTDPVEDSVFNDPVHIKEVLHRYDNVPEEEIEPFTEDEIRIVDEAEEAIERLTAPYLNDEGFLEEEELESYLNTIDWYVSDQKAGGQIAAYERSGASITILFESGIRYHLSAPIRGLLGGGDEDTRILALENFSGADYFFADLDRNLFEKDLKSIASKTDKASEQYTFNESEDYREVEGIDLSYLKDLKSFKILLWHGHGGHSLIDGSFLQTSQNYDEKERKQDKNLDRDMRLGRVIFSHTPGLISQRKYAVTSKFIDRYFPKTDNAVVYLGACESCEASNLAESFIRLGARCVIGYTNSVYVTQELNSRATLFERLRNGESIPDAIAHTKEDHPGDFLNWLAGDGKLYAYYADGITAEDQYLETRDVERPGQEDSKEDPGKDAGGKPSALPDPKTLTVGQEITFGQYYQDYEYPNDKKPIEWTVLDVQGDKALIISKYALFSCQFVDYAGPCTWEDSYLREQLNGAFFSEAFSEEEKKHIGLTTVVTEPNSQYGTDGGNDTVDRLFVLSEKEAETYFASDEARQAGGTSWAYHHGLELISPETGDYSSVVFHGIYGYRPEYNCSYWLRTMGADSGAPVAVDEKGRIYLGGYYGYYYPDADTKYMSNLPTVGVRPVLWLTSGN
ncbi:MAG: zinc ribbon domain-containing protein [Lachnospiraceae bacterium]|nr:zinc ribbon domain-containing protein [Lachnospiraceae bacterium]